MTTASVELWGKQIGAVTWVNQRRIGIFQYTPEFVASGIEVSPLQMPLSESPYDFPNLNRGTYKGLPGMLSDSLPDKFGNALINVWLAKQGRDQKSFNPVERLCYTGRRGIGALEYKPIVTGSPTKTRKVNVERLVSLSNQILNDQENLTGHLYREGDTRYFEDILRVGTSAGGARAKALLAWNEKTGDFRSGQVKTGKGYTQWLIKFDGIDGNKDKELVDPKGFGRIEYAYHLMARKAGIIMMPCRLYEEGGRAHFMTKRFDRTQESDKFHYQSLCALQHYDFNNVGAYSYEQVLQTIKRLNLPAIDREQQVRRTIFNIVTRNQDDHTKNIGFVMNKGGKWRLSPAFDITYSYNPFGLWTSQHQLCLNGKQDGFDTSDIVAFGKVAGLKEQKIKTIVQEIIDVVKHWPEFAEKANVLDQHIIQIKQTLRINLLAKSSVM